MRAIKLMCAQHRQKYSQLTIYMAYTISDVQITSLDTLGHRFPTCAPRSPKGSAC